MSRRLGVPPIEYSGYDFNKGGWNLIYYYDPDEGPSGAYKSFEKKDLPSYPNATVRDIVELTRPGNASGYEPNDSISNSTTEPSPIEFTNLVDGLDSAKIIYKASCSTDNISWTETTRLHLFSGFVEPANDSEDFELSMNDDSKSLGYIDFYNWVTRGSVATAQRDDINIPAVGTGVVYGLLEAIQSGTPNSGQVFRLTLDAVRG